jgi:hypothetical protein
LALNGSEQGLVTGATEIRDKYKGSVKVGGFNDYLSDCQFFKKTLLHIVTDTFC